MVLPVFLYVHVEAVINCTHIMIICLLDEVIFFKINLILAVPGLHCCALAFFSCGEQELPFFVVCRLLIAAYGLLTMVTPLVVECRL